MEPPSLSPSYLLAPKTLRAVGTCALVLLSAGAYLALLHAPADRMMGDVYRILYVHVPSAWLALVAYTVAFAASIAYLLHHQLGADALAEASAEVGLVFNALALATGSIWGRPTWGVWWTFDPRLTSAAVMLLLFAAYVGLRRLVDEPRRRASWAAVVAILAFVDIPVVWYSVQWWNSLHQVQSSPETMASPMVLALRVNAFAFLFAYLALVQMRVRLRLAEDRREALPPSPAGLSPLP